MSFSLPDALFGIKLPSFDDHRLFYFAAGAASVSVITLISSYFPPAKRLSGQIFRSPLREALRNPSSLSYPPRNYIPGARDVNSPYGNIRVYEWGPAEAERRVIFLHGISTPSVSLAGIASRLANKGCRVMLVDLFCRGYSDGPVATEVPYDGRLYASQILTAVTSSSVPWTGSSQGFSIVGYSLGGGLAMDFASYYPHLVDDVVIIAPGGLQRLSHISLRSKILYSTGIFPDKLLTWLVRLRLKGDENTPVTQEAPRISHSHTASRDSAQATSEHTLPGELSIIEDADGLVDKHNWYDAEQVDVEGTVAWQLDRHPGFVPAFMSSLRYAPIHKQQARWAKVGARIEAERHSGTEAENTKHNRELPVTVRSGAVLLILGGADSIVPPSEVAPDAAAALGSENLEVVVVDGAGHDVPVSHSKEVTEAIWNHWNQPGRVFGGNSIAESPVSPGGLHLKQSKSVRFSEKVQVGTSAPAVVAPEPEKANPSPRVRVLEQKLQEERTAKSLELGDARRELELVKMKLEEITGERDLLRAWVGKDASEVVQEVAVKEASADGQPPERSCPTL